MGRSAADARAVGPDGRRAVFIAFAAPVVDGGGGAGAGRGAGAGAGRGAGAGAGRPSPLAEGAAGAVPATNPATPSAARRASARRASNSRRSWRPPKVTAT